MKTTIAIAFEMAAKVREELDDRTPQDFSSMVRRRLRKEIVKLHLLEQMVHDIKYLLSDNENEEDKEKENAVYLWDNIKDRVENGKQYRDDGVEDGSDNDE